MFVFLFHHMYESGTMVPISLMVESVHISKHPVSAFRISYELHIKNSLLKKKSFPIGFFYRTNTVNEDFPYYCRKSERKICCLSVKSLFPLRPANKTNVMCREWRGNVKENRQLTSSRANSFTTVLVFYPVFNKAFWSKRHIECIVQWADNY